MTKIACRLTLLTVLALAARPARAGESPGQIVVAAHAGLDKYDAVGLKNGTANLSGTAELKNASSSLGLELLYQSSLFQGGLIGELGRPGQSGATTLLGLEGGLGFSMGALRFDALGELGFHQYGDILKDPALRDWSTRSTWLVSLGLRPGVSWEFGEGFKLLVGVYAFARWDVTSSDVTVTVASTSASSTYKLGGSQFGGGLKVGFAL